MNALTEIATSSGLQCWLFIIAEEGFGFFFRLERGELQEELSIKFLQLFFHQGVESLDRIFNLSACR